MPGYEGISSGYEGISSGYEGISSGGTRVLDPRYEGVRSGV